MQTRLIAFHLPQFHPIPENDQWWGKGFTEWTNVSRATPRFPGHYQPHLPADLGFYDLRLPEARAHQAALAQQYGVGGFCYYHYWFNGRRLLERPVNEILASGQPDHPFCLCWANENWNRRWDGQESELLIGQNYSLEDDREHFQWLAQAFRDPRYIRVEGRPLFLIYRAAALPDARATLQLWRAEARRLGLGEMFFARIESGRDEFGGLAEHGFDAAVELAPDWAALGRPLRRSWPDRILRKLGLTPRAFGTNAVFDYADVVQAMRAKPAPDYLRFNTVVPMWDNSARRKTAATILINNSPERYHAWLAETIRRARPLQDGTRLVFINAWNEWAEGNHLEPCQKWGHAYLEATRDALRQA